MRTLILSDIHANLEALDRCLELTQGKYDNAVCLGDLVGYGPDPNAVIERVRKVAFPVVRGNHDKACSGVTDASDFNLYARVAADWTLHTLTPDNLNFLRGLPSGPVATDGFGMVHGSTEDEDQYLIGLEEAKPSLEKQNRQLVFFGHTHYQGGFCLTQSGEFRLIQMKPAGDGLITKLKLSDGARYLINPGSVGQPRDSDWRAAFAILNEDAGSVEFYRTAYDLDRTQHKMVVAGLPEPLIRRLQFGR